MAGFRTHITVSGIVGVGYGAAGFASGDQRLSTCLLAGGLCCVSGMLPDLDSDSGIPLRESLALGAAVVPMLMIERFIHMGMTLEAMVLAGAFVYLFIRFGVGAALKKYTVHRGMFHSLPAAVIAGLLAFLICQCNDMGPRLYKASAVGIGYLTHLVLDELWSIECHRGRMRFKSSFGTAMKVYSPKNFWANLSTYSKLMFLTYIAVHDPAWMEQMDSHNHPQQGAPGQLHYPQMAQDPHFHAVPNPLSTWPDANSSWPPPANPNPSMSPAPWPAENPPSWRQ